MTLGLTSSGAVKIKTDEEGGGLRAVNCACCDSICQELYNRGLNSITTGSVADFWNKQKLDHFWKNQFRVQGSLDYPTPYGNFTQNFDVVSIKPECLYKSTYKYFSEAIDIPDPDDPDESIGQIITEIRLEYPATKIIDGENTYYGIYADAESTNSPDPGLLSIFGQVSINGGYRLGVWTSPARHDFEAMYVSAIGVMPYFNFEPFFRSDILPVTPQIMTNPNKPELGDYQFYKYSLVGSCVKPETGNRSCSLINNWRYDGYYPTVTLTQFTQV
jgi:hypothetical protein